MSATYDYDYLVIGGGSGGVSSAKRAAQLYNKKVAVIEGNKWGGTCVNVGCVPKKIMFQASHVREVLVEDAKMYTFSGEVDPSTVRLDWAKMREKRDKYIARLNGIYNSGLVKANVTVMEGWASFVDAHTVAVKKADGTTQNVTAEYISIAVGGTPLMPYDDIPGLKEHAISSNGFFEITEQPEKVVVVGAGYIAVELAGVFHGLGVETHLAVRKERAMRSFDADLAEFLDDVMVKSGLQIHRNTQGVAKIELGEDGKKVVTMVSGETIAGVDVVLFAAGRVPNVEALNLAAVGVAQDAKTYIIADKFQNTNVSNIFALGDVCGKIELTPMAIAAGRRLSDRVFGGIANSKTCYENVPTVVFSHPPIGTIGMSEKEATETFGADNLKIYKSKFVNLYYSMFDMEPSEKPKTFMKLICAGPSEQVVGLHICGMAADEILQGFGVAVKMGATKADFDSCVAIHPTAGEELVTMGTWGTSPQVSGAVVPPLMGAAAPLPKM